jgi:ParB-like nuclease domain
MTNLLPISGADFRDKLNGLILSNIDSTDKPKLFWIGIASLRVDHRYQRKIVGRTSEKNVIKIAAEFDWSKFAPVVVAEVEEGLFAIIDGQHRTTAAALRGIRDVPCLIHNADLAAQANAFAAINGTVTAMSTMQLHAARVAAGDAAAIQLRDVCAEAGVEIMRYPVPAYDMKAGQTLAASTLARQLARYGSKTLVAALSCITRTGDGHIGMVRAPVVEAFCAVFSIEPDWIADLEALVAAMQSFDFDAAYSAARLQASQERVGIHVPLVEMISAHLGEVLSA